MRIAYCIPQLYNPGGIERIILLKAKYLSEHGFEMHIITAEQLGKPIFFDINNSNIKFHDIGINFTSSLNCNIIKRLYKRHSMMKEYKIRLSKLLNELKCDIVVSTFSHEVNILPTLKDGSKKVVETHFPKSHQKLMAITFNFPFCTKLAYFTKNWIEENYIVKKYNTMVVLTKTDKDLWLKNNKKETICIPNMITFSGITIPSQERRYNNVLAVGHFSKIKSFESLIKIWKIVKETDSNNWNLTIVGKGEEYNNIQKLIIDLNLEDSIKLLPPTNSIQSMYLSSSIYTLTSKYEGFPMVLLEAMQCGLPCVAFDCPNGPRDIIIHGENGYLIQPNDFKSYANHLIKLIHDVDLREALGRNAISSIQKFSQQNIMSKWENLFINLKYK